jgi:ferric-dicitrate binding protein FerR (iron transport regulator)
MKETKYIFKVAQLISKLLKGEISPEEKQELENWKMQREQNLSLYNKLTNAEYLNNQQIEFNDVDIDQGWNSILGQTQRQKKKSFIFLKYAAAISAICFSLFLIYYLQRIGRKDVRVLKGNVVSHRILPGGKNAVLILSNGEKVDLKSESGTIVDKNSGVLLTNANNILNYSDQSASASDTKDTYNTIITPRGGEYQLRLADGTLVWMNALSQLRYPTKFSGQRREVFLSGEAYFEVAKNASKPFIVKTSLSQVEVIGTHFNISAYSDSEVNTTTLLEGAVQLKGEKSSAILRPDQQASVDERGLVSAIRKVDVNRFVDWKNGFFELDNSDIKQIMTKAARWYDINVKFDGPIPKNKLNGRISRSVDFAELLEILRFEGLVIDIKGKDVHIKN